MNPIVRTILILLGWIPLMFFINLIIGSKGDFNFIMVVYSLYLMPVIGVISFCISAFLNKKWIKTHKKASFIFSLSLILWCLGVLYYINSLFINSQF